MAVSKMNALKHGILSKEVVVQGRVVRESQAEFTKLHARFGEHLMPVGPMEELLVDQIVTAQWRLRRALAAESGEIALNADGGHWKRNNRDPVLLWLKWGAGLDPVSSMQQSAIGNSMLISNLRDVRAVLEREGELSEEAIKRTFVCGKASRHSSELEKLKKWLVENPEGLEPDALRAKHREQALKYLDREVDLLVWQESECEERERAEELARQAADVLPSAKVLDKILRYETKLERQLFRAMSQLERLQRMRGGESVPPPLTMEVSERN